MKTINNENGYVLLMVLMLVLLFTVLGMSLMATNINSAKQLNMKEEQVKARHQAEMGVLHYKEELKNIVEENKKELSPECSTFQIPVSGSSEDGKSEYQVGNVSCDDSLSTVISVTIESTGNYIDREEDIEATFYVNKLSPTIIEEGKIPEPSDYDDIVQLVIGDLPVLNGIFSPIESSLQVTGNLLGQNGNSLGGNNLLIQNNLFVKDKVEFKNHACIVVRDNLISEGDITSVAKVYIYVYGDAYITNSTYDFFISKTEEIFVTGDVYKDGVKVENKFKPVPSGDTHTEKGKTCSLPGSGNPTPLSPIWKLGDNIEVNYFIE